jgi:hypothetical protein
LAQLWRRLTHRSIDTPWGDDYIFLTKKFPPLRTYQEIAKHIADEYDLTHFRRIKIPLIRRIYPQLLLQTP